MSEQQNEVGKFLEGITFKSYTTDNELNITYHNDKTNAFYTEDFSIDTNNNKLETTGMELINQSPELFSNILQDKLIQEGGGEQVGFDNTNHLKAMEAIADIAIEQGNEYLHNYENRFKPEDLEIEVKDQELINIFNHDREEVESFYSIKLAVNEVDTAFKYKIEDNYSGKLAIKSPTSDETITKLMTELSIPDSEKQNMVDRIEEAVNDELSIYEETIIENKFEDELGLANEEMANRVFIGRNKISLEDIEITYEEENGKQVPKLLSKVEFYGNESEYHPDNNATFKFDLVIDGANIKRDGSNVSLDTSNNTLKVRSEENSKSLDKLVNNNLPYPLKDNVPHNMLISSIIGRRVNDNTKNTFEDKKQELILVSDLKETISNDAKQSKSKSFGLSM
jgi:hypothetical protein